MRPTARARARPSPGGAGRRSSAARAATRRWRPERQASPPPWSARSATTTSAPRCSPASTGPGSSARRSRSCDGVGSGMSVAIFDDEGDYGAVIVSGANLAIARIRRRRPSAFSQGAGAAERDPRSDQRGRGPARQASSASRRCSMPRPRVRSRRHCPTTSTFWSSTRSKPKCWAPPPVNSLAEAEAAAEFLTSRFAAVVVTAGGDGVAFHDRAGEKISLPASPSKLRARMAQATCSSEPSRPVSLARTTCSCAPRRQSGSGKARRHAGKEPMSLVLQIAALISKGERDSRSLPKRPASPHAAAAKPSRI